MGQVRPSLHPERIHGNRSVISGQLLYSRSFPGRHAIKAVAGNRLGCVGEADLV